MRTVTETVIASGEAINPTSGPARELWGATLELDDPLARLSRSATRGKVFSTLGEFCWYLSGSADAAFIRYYLPKYPNVDEDSGVVFGAYGPRLRHKESGDQIDYVIARLREKPTSRRAVVQLYEARDGEAEHFQPPCTSMLQFLVRDGHLNLVTHMRSNDVYWGLAHDLFAFTMLQELVARSLEVPLGTYTHVVGSLHLYDSDAALATQYLAEGWQASASAMPAMPPGDPALFVDQLLSAERALRVEGPEADVAIPYEPYWADLTRLLTIYALIKQRNLSDADMATRLADLRRDLVHRDYDIFVAERLDRQRT